MSVAQTPTDPVMLTSEDVASVTKRTRGYDESFVIVWYEDVKCYFFRVLYRVSYARHSLSFHLWVYLLVHLFRACAATTMSQRFTYSHLDIWSFLLES